MRGLRRITMMAGCAAALCVPSFTPAFDFNPLTARYLITGDSITALDDMTGFPIISSGLTGGPMYMPGYMHQGVSASEINEGDITTNWHDLLYPTRKRLLEDAVLPGDVVGVAIGTNSVTTQTSAVTIDGLTTQYGGLLAKGAFIEAWTILPSASNAGAALNAVNAWIRLLETDGLTVGATFYPPTRFLVVDGYTAWGGTYVGHTDSGNLHPNTNGTLKLARAKRAAYKAKNRAYCPLIYGATNPSDNLLANWNLAAGAAGTLTGAGNTLINNGVPTGIAVTVTASAGLTVQTDIVTAFAPSDSLYGGVTFPALKVTVTGTAAVQADIAITMAQIITSEPAGSAYEASCYLQWKGVGATANPTGLFSFGYGYGSVAKWSSNNSSTLTNYTNVTLGDEAVLRTRSIPAVQSFGSSTVVQTTRVRSGDAASFELVFGQPYAAKRERTPYAVPKCLNTDQDSIGGILAPGPERLTDYANGITAVAASTANVSLASAPATIDGVTLSVSDIVLLKNQTAGAENGAWVYPGSGAAFTTRATTLDIQAEIQSTRIRVTGGTVNNGAIYVCTTSGAITVGTTALTFAAWVLTGRPGKAWFGGPTAFKFEWERDRGGTVTSVAGPTTVTTTASTTQFTPSGTTGDMFRLKVYATNSFDAVGVNPAYSIWTTALP